MANDRVHIKCGGCGAWKMLFKHSGAGLHTTDNGILEWLDMHGRCHPNAFSTDLYGVPGFSLHTDNSVGDKLKIELANAFPPSNL